MIELLFQSVLLMLVYVLMLGHFTGWDWALGALGGFLLLRSFRHHVRPGSRLSASVFLKRLAFFFLFAAIIFGQVVQGVWMMLLISLRLRPIPPSGILSIPIGERTRLGALVTGFTQTLTPASALLEIDWDRGEMLFYLVDISHLDQVRANFEHSYQNYQRRVFP